MPDSDEFFLDGTEWPADDQPAEDPRLEARGVRPEVKTEYPANQKLATALEEFTARTAEIWQESAAAAARKKGPEKQGHEPLYFDLETVPDHSRFASFNLPPLPPIPAEDDIASLPRAEKVVAKTVSEVQKALAEITCPPGEWLDLLALAEQASENPRAGVFEAITKARTKRQNVAALHEERRKLLSTTPEFCRIVALGWAVGNGPAVAAVVGQPAGPHSVGSQPTTEREILELFWTLAHAHSPLIGFNILHFDLPVIFVRSAILGIGASRMLDRKPWGKDVVDVFALRFPTGGGSGDGRPRKLKSLAAIHGIDIPAGDETDGSCVERLLAEDPVKLGAYVKSDVAITREYHRQLSGYFWS